MAIPAGAVIPLDAKRRRRHDLLAELREVDHWRRLVTARLDLAVAAVTAIDEPPATLPPGLREILGLPTCDDALPEATVLMQLRAAQRDLDEYARALRESSDLATLELAGLLDAERVAHRVSRRLRQARPAPAAAERTAQGTVEGTAERTAQGTAQGRPQGQVGGGPDDPAGTLDGAPVVHLHVVTESDR